jgi:hypothetical protein
VAVNCCVAPAAMFALAGATDTDLSVAAGGTDPHPVIATTSDSNNKQMGTKRRRQMDIVRSPMRRSNDGRRVSEIAATDNHGARRHRATPAEADFSCQNCVEGCSATADYEFWQSPTGQAEQRNMNNSREGTLYLRLMSRHFLVDPTQNPVLLFGQHQ